MKCYIKNKDKNLHIITDIITDIINDPETWAGGIPAVDGKLQEMGYTPKEAAAIWLDVRSAINRICKKL